MAAYSQWGGAIARTGIHDLLARGHITLAQYDRAVAAFANEAYRSLAAGKPYFVDKTPRYALFAPRLVAAFPEAKFIFLWRHPLEVAASMITTWGGGRWVLDRFSIDLQRGLPSLLAAHQQATAAMAIRYEDLVSDPARVRASLSDFLGTPLPESLAQRPAGSLGDRSPAASSPSIHPRHEPRWPLVFANPLRRRRAAKLVHHWGADSFSTMGYDFDETLREVDAHRFTWKNLATDLVDMPRARLAGPVPWKVIRQELARRRKGERLTRLH